MTQCYSTLDCRHIVMGTSVRPMNYVQRPCIELSPGDRTMAVSSISSNIMRIQTILVLISVL
jgi:hypothetical protein